jgi:hypothetical protein
MGPTPRPLARLPTVLLALVFLALLLQIYPLTLLAAKYLDLQELLNGLEDGFRGIELGEIQSPPRPKLSVAGKGISLAMPAWRPGMQITVKICQRLRWQCGYRSAESFSVD